MTTKKKSAWRTHYTRDWALDPFVRKLDPATRMIYFELLDIAWDEHGLRDEWTETGEYVAERMGISKRLFRSCWARVKDKFVEISPGVRSQVRLESERTRIRKLSEKGRGSNKDDGLQVQPGRESHSHSQSHSSSNEEDPPASAGQGLLKIQEPPKPKPAKKHDPHREATIEVATHFKRGWVAAMKPIDGKPPSVAAADWTNLRSVVAEYGIETSKQFVDRFLADPDTFLHDTAYALRHLPSRVNKYRSTAPPPVAKKNGAPERHNNHPPTADERRREHEISVAAERAERKRQMLEEGYRFEDDGRIFDPEGRELDERGRVKKAIAS